MVPRFTRAYGVAVTLVLTAVTACGDEAAGPPKNAPTPTFVSVPADPADDPQLDALDGLIDTGGENVAAQGATSTDQIDELAMLVDDLRERIGDDARVARVTVGRTRVIVRTADQLTEWSHIPNRKLVSHPVEGWESDQLGDGSLDVSLDAVDPDVPRQVLAGIDRRTRSRRVVAIDLVGSEGAPLRWQFVVSTGGAPATVIADLDGSVSAVRWRG